MLSLMQKFVNLNGSTQRDGETMQGITSAIAVDGLKEHIYVEAMREQHVKEVSVEKALQDRAAVLFLGWGWLSQRVIVALLMLDWKTQCHRVFAACVRMTGPLLYPLHWLGT